MSCPLNRQQFRSQVSVALLAFMNNFFCLFVVFQFTENITQNIKVKVKVMVFDWSQLQMESTKVSKNKGSRNRDATIIHRYFQFTFNNILFKNLPKKYLAVTIKILSCMKVCNFKRITCLQKMTEIFLRKLKQCNQQKSIAIIYSDIK